MEVSVLSDFEKNNIIETEIPEELKKYEHEYKKITELLNNSRLFIKYNGKYYRFGPDSEGYRAYFVVDQ